MRGNFDSSGQLNVKTKPPLGLYFGFSILLVLNILSRFCVFRRFSVDLGFSVVIHTRIHHYFSSFFLIVSLQVTYRGQLASFN